MLAACVGLEGAAPYPIFVLEFTGFDVPPGYVGVDGKAIGHVIVAARRELDSPRRPCIGGVRLGDVLVSHWTTTEYRCPSDSLRVQREAMHGEGAQVGHLVLTWRQDGIDYTASAHGHTTTNLNLLKRLVESISLTAPESK
jgi:hypothetical protein